MGVAAGGPAFLHPGSRVEEIGRLLCRRRPALGLQSSSVERAENERLPALRGAIRGLDGRTEATSR